MNKPANIPERNLDDIVQALRTQRRKCSLLVGAGCSVSAGIPSARGFVELIERKFPDAYQRAEPKTYPHCMAELPPGTRHDLIAGEVDAAKVNWGHVAIAQLMRAGYVDRVLTTNFDPLVVRACALAGIHPAVYDFAVSRLLKPAQIPSMAVFHLHGQRTGFVLLNTGEECAAQARRLGPVFQNAGNGRIWIVVGYSGESDPVFDLLTKVPAFDFGLFWVGHGDDDPAVHVRQRLLTANKNVYFVRGFDADSFFVQLTQKLGCFPPTYIERPFSHLSSMIDVLTPYKMPNGGDAEVDVTANARDMINRAVQRFESRPDEIEMDGCKSADVVASAATKLFMSGRYDEVQALGPSTRALSPHFSEMAAWSSFNKATQLGLQAGMTDDPLADRLYSEAYEKYRAANKLTPEQPVVFNNWGLTLVAQAKTKHGEGADRLYGEAYRKYEAALKLKPGMNHVLSNWGIALHEQAKAKSGAEAEQLYVEGYKKFQASLAINPIDHRTLYNWAVALRERAEVKDGVEADGLLDEARKKLEAAIAIKPDMYEALYNLGNVLSDRAIVKQGDEADSLFAAAYDKYVAAVAVRPSGYLALNAWGLALQAQANAKRSQDADRLFAAAYEKYDSSIAAKPDMDNAFYNWGNALADQARTKHGSEADHLFAKAGTKYAAALVIKPSKHGALNNWGMALADRARLKCNAEIADHLFAEACEKYDEAIKVKSDEYKAIFNWGHTLAANAATKTGEAADKLFAEAGEKFSAAIKIKRDFGEAFNHWGLTLLCRAAIQDNEMRQQFVTLAIAKFNEALRANRLEALYNLACVEAFQGHNEAAMQYLRYAKNNGALPSKQHLQNDPSFRSMMNEQKFRQFVESLYATD